jgi:hypothetical protein
MKNTKQKDFYDERLHEMLRYKRPHEGKTETHMGRQVSR